MNGRMLCAAVRYLLFCFFFCVFVVVGIGFCRLRVLPAGRGKRLRRRQFLWHFYLQTATTAFGALPHCLPGHSLIWSAVVNRNAAATAAAAILWLRSNGNASASNSFLLCRNFLHEIVCRKSCLCSCVWELKRADCLGIYRLIICAGKRAIGQRVTGNG